MSNPDPFIINPSELVEARALSHIACQWPSKAARANLTSEPDDSHSNLGWNRRYNAHVSRHLDLEDRFQIGFSFTTQALIWFADGSIADSFELADNTASSTESWIDAHLRQVRLKPLANAKMPYELDASLDYTRFSQVQREMSVLGAWYDYGQVALDALVAHHPIGVSVPTVRCWPHHFDLGALFALEEGDPETARSLGVGMSPGDQSYAEPYFYCSPWPVPDVAKLPLLDNPLRWHTEGFVSAIVVAQELDDATDVDEILASALASTRDLIGG